MFAQQDNNTLKSNTCHYRDKTRLPSHSTVARGFKNKHEEGTFAELEVSTIWKAPPG